MRHFDAGPGVKLGSRRVFCERFVRSRHYSIVSEMKPILHFIAVCGVDLYHSLLAFISVEVGYCPTTDEPVNLIYSVQ